MDLRHRASLNSVVQNSAGRWPANVILDEEAGKVLDEQSGVSKSTGGRVCNISKTSKIYGGGSGLGQDIDPKDVAGDPGYGAVGGASRFFYCAKVSKKERTCNGKVENKWPTVKPINLLRYLIRLITPKHTAVLDPFMGSGSTGAACIMEGRRFVGIEKDEEAFEIAKQRIIETLKQKTNEE